MIMITIDMVRDLGFNKGTILIFQEDVHDSSLKMDEVILVKGWGRCLCS